MTRSRTIFGPQVLVDQPGGMGATAIDSAELADRSVTWPWAIPTSHERRAAEKRRKKIAKQSKRRNRRRK
jgi:hypothetical protein